MLAQPASDLLPKKVMDTNNFGYEYGYNFWVDADMIHRCEYKPSVGVKTFLLELRTNFIVRTIEGVEETIGSETLIGSVKETDQPFDYFNSFLFGRLNEYLLSPKECGRFVIIAISFTRERAVSDVTPVVMDLGVCTLQKHGESLDAARDRAIRPDILVPKHVTSIAYERVSPQTGMTDIFIIYLRGLWPISPVKDVNEASKLMNECGLCGRNPTLGALISVLKCKHAFHWHCAVNWLETNEICPTCGAKQHAYLSNSLSKSI